MKRILFFLALTVVFVVLAPAVYAVTPEETPVPQKVDYTLPYPGILADNPLYILKNLRDIIMEWLIADPVKKVEFYTLQGDKDLNAAVFLNAKGKAALAADSVVRGNTYTGNAVKIAGSLEQQGKEVPAYVIARLQTSLAKHDEVLTDLAGKAAAPQKANFESDLSTVKELEVNAASLSGKTQVGE